MADSPPARPLDVERLRSSLLEELVTRLRGKELVGGREVDGSRSDVNVDPVDDACQSPRSVDEDVASMDVGVNQDRGSPWWRPGRVFDDPDQSGSYVSVQEAGPAKRIETLHGRGQPPRHIEAAQRIGPKSHRQPGRVDRLQDPNKLSERSCKARPYALFKAAIGDRPPWKQRIRRKMPPGDRESARPFWTRNRDRELRRQPGKKRQLDVDRLCRHGVAREADYPEVVREIDVMIPPAAEMRDADGRELRACLFY